MRADSLLIAQLSDLHCGSPYSDPELMEAAVREVLSITPDLVRVRQLPRLEPITSTFEVLE